MADELDIKKSAQGPASAAVDGTSATQHDLSKQIEADRYLASKDAVKRRHRGLRFSKLLPPGTVSGPQASDDGPGHGFGSWY